MQRTIVVVGGGLAGAKGVEALREQGYAERLVLVGAEQHLPYERPALSKGYLAGDAGWDDLVVHDEAWYAEHDVEVVEAATVDHLDTRAREVGDDRGHRWTYVGVLLATGAAPRTGGLSGAQLDGATCCGPSRTPTRCGRSSAPGRGWCWWAAAGSVWR